MLSPEMILTWLETHVKMRQSRRKALAAVEEALDKLARICQGRDVTLVAVADRGFGHQRWLSAVRARGWHFVQRLSRVFFVEVEDYIGNLRECRLRKGARPKDWGHGTFGEDGVIQGRLITVYARDAKEPWYLVTDLEGVCAAEVVGIYKRRMWIEALFRDHKNRDWGLSLDAVRFNKYKRYERLFYVLALAFIFLCAFGAAAEAEGFAQKLKANTVKKRTLNLLRIGHYYLREKRRKGESGAIDLAFAALEGLPS